MKTPVFWYQPERPIPALHRGLSRLYEALRRFHVLTTRPILSPIPTICIGNLTAGGSGKTPIVMALHNLLTRPGLFVLTRGYRAAVKGPVLAAPVHTAFDIGDEACLYRTHDIPTVIAKRRLEGARWIARHGGHLILMDDGLQNREIKAHINFSVVDGAVGLGNGQVIPAGPLREPLRSSLPHVDAIILIGNDETGLVATAFSGSPVFRATSHIDCSTLPKNARVMPFAGLGRPEKFFAALRNQGLDVVAPLSFPDHHAYTSDDLSKILDRAKRENAIPVTTAKDASKIPARWVNEGLIKVIGHHVTFDDAAALRQFIDTRLPTCEGSSS